jgi:membrane protease YdiL (CAAX protease family)
MKNFYSFILFLFLAIVNGYIFQFLNNDIFHLKNKTPDDFSQIERIIIIIIIAPILETLIFQHILYLILKKIKIKNDTVCIIIMSLIFSQVHWYNWLYVIMAFFGGLILNSFYATINKRTPKYSYILTVLFHALFNLYGFLFVM